MTSKQPIMFVAGVLFVLAGIVSASAVPTRIFQGNDIPIEELSFLAAVSSSAHGQICGGAILTSYYVMTAAHCTSPFPDLQVRVGSSYRSSGGSLIYVSTINIHPDYDGNITADLAVLGLAQPIQFNDIAVTQAAIPYQDLPVVDGIFAFIAGWGFTELFGIPSEHLKYNQVQTISHQTCTASYPDLPSSFTCAYAETTDICIGDTGGPLISSGMVTGIAVFGYCGSRNIPSLYTNVAVYSNWIVQAASGVPNSDLSETEQVIILKN